MVTRKQQLVDIQQAFLMLVRAAGISKAALALDDGFETVFGSCAATDKNGKEIPYNENGLIEQLCNTHNAWLRKNDELVTETREALVKTEENKGNG